MKFFAALPLFAILASCSSSETEGNSASGVTQPPKAAVFGGAYTDVEIEVDYQGGAEPYTGAAGTKVSDLWSVTRTNLGRIFPDKNVSVPSDLTQMQKIDVSGELFTSDALLGIAKKHRDKAPTASKATYYVVFVNGYFQDENGKNDAVLGVSLGTTGVLAMFKPVIASSGLPAFPSVERFVEQSTLVHEIGHAVGLVDNGVSMVANHKDATHGAHCTNTKCVMYWENEGVSATREFAKQLLLTGNVVLFKEDCLADVDAARKK